MRHGRRVLFVLMAAAAAMLAGCASAPTNFYTLQQSPAEHARSSGAAPAFLIDVLPVAVPAQVDQLQLLVRQSEQRVIVLDTEHWAAPLATELRSALAADLVDALGTRDMHGLAHAPGTPLYRIQLDVRRFDSWPARHALIEADWSIRGEAEHALATCTSSAVETVAPGYDALVQGHQRAIAHIAGDIAAVLRNIHAGTVASCPQ
jgi:uncharacterized lipoprotein YmbA